LPVFLETYQVFDVKTGFFSRRMPEGGDGGRIVPTIAALADQLEQALPVSQPDVPEK
jgi:hypothetical protein